MGSKVLKCYFGGHTADAINAAESNPNQFIDKVNRNDESSSQAAEKALGQVPQPSRRPGRRGDTEAKGKTLVIVRRVTIWLLLGSAFAGGLGQTSPLSRVEAALDSWSDRTGTRDAILKINHNPVLALITIAESKQQPEIRRSHAIALLGIFKTAGSEHALGELANDSNPKYRCLALQSLAELKSERSLSVLITKLDDQAVCMKTVSTDPAEEHDVYVSDEAVRLLEQITRQSFGQGSSGGHRATKPWKEWWSKQGGKSKLPKP